MFKQKKNIDWDGSCLKCGKCCSEEVTRIQVFSSEDTKNAIEWGLAKGYNFNISKDKKHIILRSKNPCPHLTHEKLCDIYGTDKMPKWCKWYPENYWGCNVKCPEEILPEGCGYSIKTKQ